MTLLLWALAVFWAMGATWVFYLAIMNLDRNKKKLTVWAKVFGYPVLLVGLVLDVLFNAVIGSVLFLELPRLDLGEWLFSGRVSRWNASKYWRGDMARFFCSNFLDPFDEGGHCS
jgi:hypothetical protein